MGTRNGMIGIQIDEFIVIWTLELLNTVVYDLKVLLTQAKIGNFEIMVKRIEFSGDHRFFVFTFKAVE